MKSQVLAENKKQSYFSVLRLYFFVAVLSIQNFCVAAYVTVPPFLQNNHHLGHISSNILFTAPHSKAVYRGGKDYVIMKDGVKTYETLTIHDR